MSISYRAFSQEEYDRELNYIFNQFPLYQRVGKVAYKPGIETMIDLDKRFDSPHKNYITIHIAGTNGKGSVSHMIASALHSLGFKTGLYTSPHIIDFRERVKVNGKIITKEFVFNFLTQNRELFYDLKPSFFEITTLMAFEYFKDQSVDIAVIETGLGGRLDSTNIINPILSIITNIGLDHCEHLGYSLQEIANEKAGIIKPNTPVVIGEYLASTKEIFINRANELNSKITFAQDLHFKEVKVSAYKMDLRGDYQIKNLKTVLSAIAQLSISNTFLELSKRRSVEWNLEKIGYGIENAAKHTGLRGRWEIISESPTIICDTGHNAHGLKYVFSQLERVRESDGKKRRLYLIIGFVAEKDLDPIVKMMPLDGIFVLTKAKIERALDEKELFNICINLGLNSESFPNVRESLENVLNKAERDDIIFIGGSTFIVAEALQYFDSLKSNL